jgi:hypothetical protein
LRRQRAKHWSVVLSREACNAIVAERDLTRDLREAEKDIAAGSALQHRGDARVSCAQAQAQSTEQRQSEVTVTVQTEGSWRATKIPTNHERHRWILDSIEEGTAAVEEDGARVVHVPLWLLPQGVREGDVLHVTREAGEGTRTNFRVEIDREATAEARRRSAEQVSRPPGPRRDPGGDIKL